MSEAGLLYVVSARAARAAQFFFPALKKNKTKPKIKINLYDAPAIKIRMCLYAGIRKALIRYVKSNSGVMCTVLEYRSGWFWKPRIHHLMDTFAKQLPLLSD